MGKNADERQAAREHVADTAAALIDSLTTLGAEDWNKDVRRAAKHALRLRDAWMRRSTDY